jgi:L-aminopeptidase/D-esterase-like protein
MNTSRPGTPFAVIGALCILGIVGRAQSGSSPKTLQPRTAAGPSLDFQFDGVHVGTAEYAEGPTGVTVFYFPSRVMAAVDVRGGLPGTSGFDGLRLGYGTPSVDAIVLAGGSLYGLEAIDGVRSELLATGKRDARGDNIAVVHGAIIYDFTFRTNSVYPDKELGRTALRVARSGVFPLGAQGAGRSASVGKYFGRAFGEMAGQGAAFRQVGATKILVVSVVNAGGVIVDRQGQVVRGNRDPQSGGRTHVGADLNNGVGLRKRELELKRRAGDPPASPEGNTTLTVVVTNQKIAYPDLQRLAIQVHTSMARAIQPFQTRGDGDVLFAVTTAEIENPAFGAADLSTVAGELAWDAVLASLPR